MNDQQLMTALASMSEEDLSRFCQKVLDKSVTLDISYDNYVALSLLLIKYFYSGPAQPDLTKETATHS